MKSIFIFTSICSLTGLFPFIIGFKKRKVINETYALFIWYVAIAFFAELLGRILLICKLYDEARISSNVYVLCEGVLFLLLFYKWNIISKMKVLFSLCTILILSWIYENQIYSSLTNTNSFYIILYSVITVLLAIELFQKEYYNIKDYIFRDSFGIISSTLIINYSYRAVFESLYLVKLDLSNNFYFIAFFIFIILNVFSNCTFTYAIHCMSQKRRLS
jgi:hypothetical protein